MVQKHRVCEGIQLVPLSQTYKVNLHENLAMTSKSSSSSSS